MCDTEPVFPCNCADIAARMEGTLPLWDGMIAGYESGPKSRQTTSGPRPDPAKESLIA